jgi:hypothetical protein
MGRAQPKTRVYVAAAVSSLTGLVEAGSLPTRGTGHAVTQAVRAGNPDGDDDEWEFEAYSDAASASLDLLDPTDGELRRVVISVDLDPGDVQPLDGDVSTAVGLPAQVPLRSVAAVHIDDAEAGDVVARVLAGAPARLLDDIALAWFDAAEISVLVDQLATT